jgi:hypothetical protein
MLNGTVALTIDPIPLYKAAKVTMLMGGLFANTDLPSTGSFYVDVLAHDANGMVGVECASSST